MVRLCLCLALLLPWQGSWGHEGLLWFANGQATAQAHQAVDFLADAASEGLDAGDYDAEGLRRALSDSTPPDIAQADARLTLAMARYLTDLHVGRIDPELLGQRYDQPIDDAFDPIELLHRSVPENQLISAIEQALPKLAPYAALRRALAQYRALIHHAAWLQPLPAYGARPLKPGRPYLGLAQLAERLMALGDLASGACPLPALYEGALVDAIRAYQLRHGLEVDGVIGPATFKSLNTPVTHRVRQLEITLERLRWTPLLQSDRMVVINIPEFVLRAYDIREGRIDMRARMRVIVGKALDTRTPIFDEDMRFIEFSPYWNVPSSIALEETVPKLRQDPGYFDEEGFEFVDADGQVLTALTTAHIDALQRGALRIRQRPGPRNALGDIKFVFPNSDHIYLHHTPAPALFEKVRRDFSHGCIRVEDPVALARFVLQDEPEWTEERIRETMAQGKSSTLRLRHPVRVLVAYATVVVKDHGKIHFLPDLYDHDPWLDEALRQRQPFAEGSFRRLRPSKG
jgi:murein L,D-transpeptidase YcbB/YkuD